MPNLICRKVTVGRNYNSTRDNKSTGKNFNRREYNALVGTETTAPLIRKGDLLVIISLDRLGRNYVEIRQQWNYIINELGADIKV